MTIITILENLARDIANLKVATHDYLEDCHANADQNIIDIIEFRKKYKLDPDET